MALTLQQVRTLPAFANMSDSDIISHASSNGFDTSAMMPDTSNEGDIQRGFKNTFRQLPQIGYGLTAIAGATGEKVFGEGGISTGIKKAGLEGYKEASATMAEHSKPSDSLTYSWDRAKEGHFGDLADWVQHGIGYAGGQGLQLIATAGFGNLAAKEGAKAFAQDLTTKLVASEAAKIGAADAAKVAANTGITAMTAEAIQQAAVKGVASKIGGIGANTAMGGMALGMEGGEIGGDLATKAQERGTPLTGAELVQGFGATIGAGALEFVGDKFGLDILTGKSKLYKALGSAPGLGGRVGRGVAAGTIAGIPEAATEYGQTLTEEYGKGNDPFSAEAKQQAFDAAGQGAIGGHVMGFAGGLLSAAKPKTPEQIQAEQLKAEKIKADLAATPLTGALGGALAAGGFTNQGDSIYDINPDNNLDLRTDEQKAQDDTDLVNHANDRLATLNRKAKGTKDQIVTDPSTGKQVKIKGEWSRILSYDEMEERKYLIQHANNPAELARFYTKNTAIDPANNNDNADASIINSTAVDTTGLQGTPNSADAAYSLQSENLNGGQESTSETQNANAQEEGLLGTVASEQLGATPNLDTLAEQLHIAIATDTSKQPDQHYADIVDDNKLDPQQATDLITKYQGIADQQQRQDEQANQQTETQAQDQTSADQSTAVTFQPTHELNDGTQVQQIGDNTYVDQAGDEWGADDAKPIGNVDTATTNTGTEEQGSDTGSNLPSYATAPRPEPISKKAFNKLSEEEQNKHLGNRYNEGYGGQFTIGDKVISEEHGPGVIKTGGGRSKWVVNFDSGVEANVPDNTLDIKEVQNSYATAPLLNKRTNKPFTTQKLAEAAIASSSNPTVNQQDHIAVPVDGGFGIVPKPNTTQGNNDTATESQSVLSNTITNATGVTASAPIEEDLTHPFSEAKSIEDLDKLSKTTKYFLNEARNSGDMPYELYESYTNENNKAYELAYNRIQNPEVGKAAPVTAKKPDWEMTRDEYKNSFDPRDYNDANYDRMIHGAVFNEKITQAEADKKLIRDYSGNKYHWAKTRKELEQEKKEAVKNAKAARAEGNKNPIHSVKWAQKSDSNTAKNNITSTNLHHNKLLEVHQERVQEALSEGKSVPQEVLADYPDLQKPVQETANPIHDTADVSKKGENVDIVDNSRVPAHITALKDYKDLQEQIHPILGPLYVQQAKNGRIGDARLDSQISKLEKQLQDAELNYVHAVDEKHNASNEVKSDLSTSDYLGKNKDDQSVHEDKNGKRYIQHENGLQEYESVSIVPSRNKGVEIKTNPRNEKFLIVDDSVGQPQKDYVKNEANSQENSYDNSGKDNTRTTEDPARNTSKTINQSGVSDSQSKEPDQSRPGSSEKGIRSGSGQYDSINTDQSKGNGLSGNEGLGGHQADVSTEHAVGRETSTDTSISESIGANNLSLIDKPAIALTPAKRRDVNILAEAILKKPVNDITEDDKNILRQYTGHGGLDVKASADKGEGIFNQHYSAYDTIKAMYGALMDAGVKMDNNLEPSVGSGNFIGMHPRANWTAVDIDTTNTEVVRRLYPDASVFNESYETFRGKNFDLIISNVPFASFSSLAREHAGTIKPAFKAIHNFFFAQSVDKLKTGGVMAFMTSTGTMDGIGEGQRLREHLIQKMDVIGAFRLPMGTQKANASTDVMIDVIFLQKRPDGVVSKQPEKNQAFVDIANKDGYKINQYFVDYPEAVLGDLSIGANKTSMGKVGWIVTGDADYSKMAIEPQDYSATVKSSRSEFATPDAAQAYAIKKGLKFTDKVSEPYFQDGFIFDTPVTYSDVSGSGLFGRKATGVQAEKLAALKKIDETHDAKLVQQYEEKYSKAPHTDKQLTLWAKVNHAAQQLKSYLALFDKHFNLSEIFTKQVRFKDSGKIEINEHSSLMDRAESVENADGIFSPKTDLISADEIQDLLSSGDYAQLSNGSLQNARLYYAGNIYKKIDDATKVKPASQRDKQLAKLNRVKPALWPIDKISFSGKESWLPASAIASIGIQNYADGTKLIGGHAIADNHLLHLYNQYINNDDLVKKDSKETPEEYADRLKAAQTLVHTEILPLIKQKILDDGLADEVAEAYNREKNFFAAPIFDGSSLRNLPTQFKGKPFQLMLHQLEGAERAIYNKKGVLAFSPGLGKTPTAIIVADQLLQKGVMKKPLFIVPANTIPQWESSTRSLYPDAKVYEFPKYKTGINKGKVKEWPSMTAADKEQMVYDLTNNQYDYTFISTNLAQKFSIPAKKLSQYLDELTESISGMEKPDEELNKSQIKAKETRIAKIRMLKATMMNAYKESIDTGFDMGKMGFDALFADEVQYYKNIGMQSEDAKGGIGANVAINAKYPLDADGKQDKTKDPLSVTLGSSRSYDFRFKTRFISENNNGNNIFLLTGTPTPNKPLELMTLLHHLDIHILDEYGINNVGDFVNEFFDIQEVEETGIDGTNKLQAALVGIMNIPALKSIITRFIDYRSPESAKDLTRPKQIDKVHTILRNDASEEIFADVQTRILQSIEDAQAKKSGDKGVIVEPMIKMYGAGRDASIDVRLYTPSVDEKGDIAPGTLFEKETRSDYSKIAKTVELVAAKNKLDPEAGQLIFLDRLKFSGDNGSTHEDIRNDILKATGLDPKEVIFVSGQAFVNPDTGKQVSSGPKPEALQKIMDYYNAGKIKVLIGNTSKLGVGVDLQVTTTDIYQIDKPYRPDEIEQRNNRGVRQGNRNSEVTVHTFNQPGTFDAMSDRIIANKQGFNDVFWKEQESDKADVKAEEAPSAYDAAIELEQDPFRKRKLEVERDLSGAAYKSSNLEKQISNLAKRIRTATTNHDAYLTANQGIDNRPTPLYEDQSESERKKSIAAFKVRMTEQRAKNVVRIGDLAKDIIDLNAEKDARQVELDAHKEHIASIRANYVVNGIVSIDKIKTTGDVKFSKSTTPVVNPHSKTSLNQAVTKAMDTLFGQGWTNRLMATGKFKMISAAEATGLIGKNAMFHKVWHGSPHDHNKFDSAYIDTGEGAQAFGWGHYFSDLKTIAEWYRDRLQNKQVKLLVDGKDVTELARVRESRAIGILLDELKYPNMGTKNGLSEDQIKAIIDKVILEQTPRSGENDPNWIKSLEKIRDYLAELKTKKLEIGRGKLYEVDLTPSQDEYLDWDKPLSQQSDVVKAGLKELHKQLEGDLLNEYLDGVNADWIELTGQELYKSILDQSHQDGLFNHPDIYDRSVPNDEASSHLLHSLGIRGIRYQAEQGQSEANNYVVFNDADVKIEVKYSKNGDVIAFYNPADDTTYLVHDNITQNTSAKALQGLMLHEIGVHALTLGKSNEVFKDILRRFEALKKTNPKVQAAFNRVPKDTKEEDIVEEALAYYLEENPKSSLAQRIVEWFRQAVRALGKTLPVLERAKFSQWANKLTEAELIGMATSALKSAPDSLQFDNVGRNREGIKLSGDNKKLLAPNGTETEGLVLFHGGDNYINKLDRSGVYRGVFASADPEVSLSHGEKLTRFEVTGKIKKGWLDADVGYEKTKTTLKSVLKEQPYAKNYLKFDDIYNIVIYEDEEIIGEKDLYDNYDLMFELQALRADVAYKLGYDAVSMKDEHGISYVILNASKVEPSSTERSEIKWDITQSNDNGDNKKLLAPNGKPSNLNAMQWAQVRTPEFLNWFGDWINDPQNASKVVDENGEPLVVYHKTRAFKDFTEFEPTKSIDGWDIHFGTKESANDLNLLGDVSKTRIIPAFLNIKHMPHTNHDDGHWGQHQLIHAWEEYWRGLPIEDKRQVRDMQVSDGIKNNYGSGFGKYIKNKAIDMAKSGTSGSMVVTKFMADEMFKYGMTGLSYRNAFEDKGSTSYIVMAPNQIKSAIGNNGDFSDSNNIKFSRSTPSNTPADNSAMRSFFAPALGKQALGWLAGLFQRNHLIDFVAQDLPELINYKLLSQEKDNFTNQRENELGKSYKEMLDKLDKKTMHELGRVQGMATRLVTFSPATANENTPMTEEERAVYDAYSAMPEAAKEIYVKMRKDYQDDLTEKNAALIERIKAFPADKETQAEIIRTIEKHFDQFKEGDYFPLSRDGSVIVKATNADGELVIEHVATQADAYKLVKEMTAQGYDNTHIIGKDAYDRDLLAGNAANEMAALAHKTISDLKEKSIQGKLTESDFNDLFSEFNQLLINTLPDSSYRKHFIHRKGTLGESTDTLRAYAKTRTSAVKMIASLTYDHQIQDVLNNADKAIKEMDKVAGSDTLAIKSIVNELKLREAALKSTEINAVSQVLTSLGFMGALGFNIGSAAVNMLQVVGVALPELSGRHGYIEATKEVSAAYKLLFNPANLDKASGLDITKNPHLSAIAKQAMKHLASIGKIDLTMTHDSIAAGKNPSYSSNPATRAFGAAAKYSGYFFHVAESANRQITGMAAFNLAYKKNGGNFEAAIAEAVDVIDRTQFDYGQGNRARYMMSNTARVLTLFKAYALGMSYYIGRNAYQYMKGETPEVRLQARKTLVASMAMSFATAGLFGMPIGIEAFAGIGGVAAFKYKGAKFAVPGAIGGMLIFQALLAGLGADDEDELETEFRNWLTDNFDQTTAEWVTKGPARLLPIGDIASRTSQSELWWRSQNKQLEGTDQYNAIATALIGPIGSQVAGLFTAKKMYEDGQYSRMVESMSPAFLRNAIAANRMGSEGVTNLKGDKIIQRDLTPVELINKVIGFNPTVVTNTYDANSAIAKESTKHTIGKSHLVNRWISGDATERSDLMKGAIKDFNESVPPSERITLKSLFKSMRSRKGIDKHTKNGLYLSKKQNYLRDIGRFNRQE